MEKPSFVTDLVAKSSFELYSLFNKSKLTAILVKVFLQWNL